MRVGHFFSDTMVDPNNACFSGTKHQNEPRLCMQLVSGKGSFFFIYFVYSSILTLHSQIFVSCSCYKQLWSLIPQQPCVGGRVSSTLNPVFISYWYYLGKRGERWAGLSHRMEPIKKSNTDYGWMDKKDMGMKQVYKHVNHTC